MNRRRSLAGHVVLFGLAIASVYLGVHIGRSMSPTIGATLWLAAGLIATLNFIRMSWQRPAIGLLICSIARSALACPARWPK